MADDDDKDEVELPEDAPDTFDMVALSKTSDDVSEREDDSEE